jgi:TatD DNase family protein
MLIDSHCHLDRLDLTNTSLATILEAAKLAGVGYILCPGIDLEHFPNILAIAKQYSSIINIGVGVGVHPTEKGLAPEYDELLNFAQEQVVLAIGETGLDFAYCKHDQELQNYQRTLFALHIQVAKTVGKPLIIHSRATNNAIIDMLQVAKADAVGGVMHCFTEDWEAAKAALDLNFYISFSGIITFKNADALCTVAKKVPLDRILIETDAPYLAPIPMRGKTNVPAYVRYVAEFLAKLRNLSLEELTQQTSDNFFKLFGKVE